MELLLTSSSRPSLGTSGRALVGCGRASTLPVTGYNRYETRATTLGFKLTVMHHGKEAQDNSFLPTLPRALLIKFVGRMWAATTADWPDSNRLETRTRNSICYEPGDPFEDLEELAEGLSFPNKGGRLCRKGPSLQMCTLPARKSSWREIGPVHA